MLLLLILLLLLLPSHGIFVKHPECRPSASEIENVFKMLPVALLAVRAEPHVHGMRLAIEGASQTTSTRAFQRLTCLCQPPLPAYAKLQRHRAPNALHAALVVSHDWNTAFARQHLVHIQPFTWSVHTSFDLFWVWCAALLDWEVARDAPGHSESDLLPGGRLDQLCIRLA